jgi:hypothetical protein
MNNNNKFLVNQSGSTGAGMLNLINIPNSGYSDSTDTTLALIDMTSNTGGDNTPYETYIAPLLDVYVNKGNYDSTTATMPSSSNPNAGTEDTTSFVDPKNIIGNFLFTDGTDSRPNGIPGQYINAKGVMDLSTIYE